jgi:hypothetical protein
VAVGGAGAQGMSAARCVPGTPARRPHLSARKAQVGALPPAAAAVVRRYAAGLSSFDPAAVWAAALTRALPWAAAPSEEDYLLLWGESPYAAGCVRACVRGGRFHWRGLPPSLQWRSRG